MRAWQPGTYFRVGTSSRRHRRSVSTTPARQQRRRNRRRGAGIGQSVCAVLPTLLGHDSTAGSLQLVSGCEHRIELQVRISPSEGWREVRPWRPSRRAALAIAGGRRRACPDLPTPFSPGTTFHVRAVDCLRPIVAMRSTTLPSIPPIACQRDCGPYAESRLTDGALDTLRQVAHQRGS